MQTNFIKHKNKKENRVERTFKEKERNICISNVFFDKWTQKLQNQFWK